MIGTRDDIAGHITLVKFFQQQSKIPGIIVKMGPNGVIVVAENKTVHYPALPLAQIVSVSGAGDSLAAGIIWSLIAQKQVSLHVAVKFGLASARMSLESVATINPLLTASTLHQIVLENRL